MKIKASICLVGLVSSIGFSSATAQTGAYPSRPIRIVVPASPGGTLDIVMRLVGQQMSQLMGQTVIVDNRVGASTNIGAEYVARSPADGYTLLGIGITLSINPILFDKLPFDAEKSFAPISLLVTGGHVLIVHPSVPATSVKQLIALAAAKPKLLTSASGGVGTTSHIAVELFKQQSKTEILDVPYKAGAQAIQSILSGETDLGIIAVAIVTPAIKEGRLRALAITSSQRSTILPKIPTLAESGLPGFEFTTWYGLLAPAATPSNIIAALNTYITKAIRNPALTQLLLTESLTIVASSPEAFAVQIKSDRERWSKALKPSTASAN